MDENLGPVAVSLRREKLDEHKEHGQQYNYRVIFRTSEVCYNLLICSLLHLILKGTLFSGIFRPVYFVYICFPSFVTVINDHKYTTVIYKLLKNILALRCFCFIWSIYFLDNVLSG